jgi:hypothetical protein
MAINLKKMTDIANIKATGEFARLKTRSFDSGHDKSSPAHSSGC